MSGHRPSTSGTAFIAVLGGYSLFDAGNKVVKHAATGGFTPLELGIVASLALCGAALILAGLFRRPSAEPAAATEPRDAFLWGGIAIAVLAAREIPQYTFLAGAPRLIGLWRSAWDFLPGGGFTGYAVYRQRQARASRMDSAPGPLR